MVISPIPATCHCKFMVGGRVVKLPLPAIGHDWREGDEITDICRGRREGGEITDTCYMSLQVGRRVVKSPLPVTCHCKVMVGGRVVKLSIPATDHGRREGSESNNTCYRSW